MRLRTALPLIALLSATSAHAAGINLSWNDCGTFGQSLETFACNTNSGNHQLYVSFVSPVPMTQFVGIELAMEAAFQTGSIPSWWAMQTSGGCRTGSFSGNANFTSSPGSCADSWAGQAMGGADARPLPSNPNRLWLRGVAAVSSANPMTIDDATEYYGFLFQIGNQKTVGGGACSGCSVPACILLTSVNLVQPAGVGNYTLTQPISNTLVGWQCPAFNGTPEPQCFLCPVPGQKKSWGAIKSLYR